MGVVWECGSHCLGNPWNFPWWCWSRMEMWWWPMWWWPRVFFFKIPISATHLCVDSTKDVGFQNKNKWEGWNLLNIADIFRDDSTKTSPLEQQKITRIDQLQGIFGNSKRTKHTRALAKCFSSKSWTWILKWGCYMLDLWTYFTKSYVLR